MPTPRSSLALPIAYWQDDVAQGRERTALVAGERAGESSPPPANRTMDELLRAYEELGVAEEELRSQNEELLRTHELAESERRHYHDLFERAPVPYIITDPDGVIREANRAAGLLLRCRPDRLIGKPFVVFTQDVGRRRLRSALNELQATSDNVTIRLNITPRGESVIRVEATCSIGRDNRGTPVEVRWLIVDRTRELRAGRARRRRALKLEDLVAQRTAELQRAQELKDQLLATVSHEFRTALSAIGGYADLLAMGIRGSLSELQLADIRNIQQAHNHLALLINDLLDYSRLVAGGDLKLDIEDVCVADALRSVAELVAPQARARGVMVRLVAPEDSAEQPLVVRADSERLTQIALNLLTNAVKFTPPQGQVEVRWYASDPEGFIAISDTGPGIPENKREEIFQPFIRLIRSGVPGTGLGLAISRDLARAMVGDITVASVPGEGSTFVLRIPRSTRLATDSLAD